ncbi:MAG: hypothetical protein IT169_07535 [Bryobacterales bacterium]|nr:hypothetical protein [Bryobacterales bacterium]
MSGASPAPSASARRQTALYRAAASCISNHCLATPDVESIFIRRSVASGEAQFPWSDVDLGIVLSRFASEEEEGLALERLWTRYRLARLLFPRLGEAEVHAHGSLEESAIDDPYRASIDRRAAIPVLGAIPPMPPVPIAARDAIRRLIFWFDDYVPRSLRQKNHRNARKFAIEIWNAWRTASGGIAEPYLTRREAEHHWRESSDAPLLARAEESAGSAVRVCLTLANRAHSIHRPALPRLANPVSAEVCFLPGTAPRTLHLLPGPESEIPDGMPRPRDFVMTPEALDLFLNTQDPFLWHGLPAQVQDCLGGPPSHEAWLHACHRLASGQRLRVAGFVGTTTGRHQRRLRHIERILSLLERGVAPPTVTMEGDESSSEVAIPSIGAYYRECYPALLREALSLRARAQALFPASATGSPIG